MDLLGDPFTLREHARLVVRARELGLRRAQRVDEARVPLGLAHRVRRPQPEAQRERERDAHLRRGARQLVGLDAPRRRVERERERGAGRERDAQHDLRPEVLREHPDLREDGEQQERAERVLPDDDQRARDRDEEVEVRRHLRARARRAPPPREVGQEDRPERRERHEQGRAVDARREQRERAEHDDDVERHVPPAHVARPRAVELVRGRAVPSSGPGPGPGRREPARGRRRVSRRHGAATGTSARPPRAPRPAMRPVQQRSPRAATTRTARAPRPARGGRPSACPAPST